MKVTSGEGVSGGRLEVHQEICTEVRFKIQKLLPKQECVVKRSILG